MVVPIAEGLLTVPGQDDTRFAGLVRKLRLLALREILGRDGPGLSRPVARAMPVVQGALAASARASSAATLEAIGSEDVLPPVLAMASGLADADACLRAAVPPLLVALGSVRGGLPETVLWDVPIGALPLVAHGVLARFTPAARGLVASPSGVEIRLGGGALLPADRLRPGASIPEVELVPTFFPVPGSSAHLSLHDANPLAMLEEHPDKKGNAVDLGGRAPGDWTAALSEALELVRLALPTVHAELEGSLRRIVPVGFEPERHLSASYREAPGLVYLTLHPSALTLAEAIVHETQHGKLNVLGWFDPALSNGRTTWTPSPVRPDLRPLSGVLLAVHAFVPVAAMHLRLAELGHPITHTPEFAMRRAQVIAGNERGLEIVRRLGEPTAIGRQLLGVLEELHRATREAAPPGPPADAEALPPG